MGGKVGAVKSLKTVFHFRAFEFSRMAIYLLEVLWETGGACVGTELDGDRYKFPYSPGGGAGTVLG
jgi:hypothetical protein